MLPAFMADYNTRFAKLPANKKDLHRPLRVGDDLEDAFANSLHSRNAVKRERFVLNIGRCPHSPNALSTYA
jgi:hypothetical protein